jgi:abortive infection bacteriophage resistance protein
LVSQSTLYSSDWPQISFEMVLSVMLFQKPLKRNFLTYLFTVKNSIKFKFGKMKQQLKKGDKVAFDKNCIKRFVEETTNVNDEVTKYQKLVLSGMDQVGQVKEYGQNMTTVAFPDGWDLPIPTKYLVLTPDK